VLAQAAVVLWSLAAPVKAPAQACAPPQHTRWSWSPGEITLGGAFVTTLWVDRKQTIAERAAGYKETNWFMGPRPSTGQINTYTISFVLVGLGAAALVPRGTWRVGVLAILVGGELAAIQKSVGIGFPIRF
jgi:hypothetical protein